MSIKFSLYFEWYTAKAINHVVQATFLDVTLQSGKNQFVTSQGDEAVAIMAMSRLEPLECRQQTGWVNCFGASHRGEHRRRVVTAYSTGVVVLGKWINWSHSARSRNRCSLPSAQSTPAS